MGYGVEIDEDHYDVSESVYWEASSAVNASKYNSEEETKRILLEILQKHYTLLELLLLKY